MYMHAVIAVTAVVFLWQLQLCFSGKSRKRLLPMVILGDCILGLTIFTGIGNAMEMPSAPFGAAVFAIILMLPLSAMALAWLIYGIVRLVQNRRK